MDHKPTKRLPYESMGENITLLNIAHTAMAGVDNGNGFVHKFSVGQLAMLWMNIVTRWKTRRV